MNERKDLDGLGNMILNEIASPGYLTQVSNFSPSCFIPPPRLIPRLRVLFGQQLWVDCAEGLKKWAISLTDFITEKTTSDNVIDFLEWGLEYINGIHVQYARTDSPGRQTDPIIKSWESRVIILVSLLEKYKTPDQNGLKIGQPIKTVIEVVRRSATRVTIDEYFDTIKQRCFDEKEYNQFASLLTDFFEHSTVTLPVKSIKAKHQSKGRIASVMQPLYRELKEAVLKDDIEYLKIIKILSVFSKYDTSFIYNDITRK